MRYIRHAKVIPHIVLALASFGAHGEENVPVDNKLKAEPKIIAVQEAIIDTQQDAKARIEATCREIGNKLGSVSVADCLTQNFDSAEASSVENRAYLYTKFLPKPNKEPRARVLLVGGVHGDEYSSVSIVFKWIKTLNKHHSGLFNWQVFPLLNPDGLLQKKAQRQNANGVDINRNFPTPNWDVDAKHYWEKKTYKNKRRYPGPYAASETETQLLLDVIEEFKPDVIISVHAPHSLVDYDGPPKAPDALGSLNLRRLGVYPGSLGNYAGVHKEIQIITIELASAGIMPSDTEISTMWTDLVRWLIKNAAYQKKQANVLATFQSSKDETSSTKTKASSEDEG